MILQNIPEGAEVLEIVAHVPETAYNAGVREARNRTNRGFTYGCVGVIEVERKIDVTGYNVNEEGFSQDYPTSQNLRGYQPVLMQAEGS